MLFLLLDGFATVNRKFWQISQLGQRQRLLCFSRICVEAIKASHR
jgi:hypothetical protein